MTTRLPLALTAAVAAFASAAAHAGGIQDDIEACGEAAVAATLIEEEGTLLRFVSDRGNRNRTLTLKALRDDAEPLVLACKMKRSDVEEVMIAE